MNISRVFQKFSLVVLCCSGLALLAEAAQAQSVEIIRSVHGVSKRVSEMNVELRPGKGERHDEPLFQVPLPLGHRAGQKDPVLQSATPGPRVSATTGLNFAGVGQGDYGFTPNAAPPDTTGVVGATQYVQWVNESFAVFDKATGALVQGPVPGNQLFTSLGGGCASNNDGDPIVQYDKLNNRWVLTQFSVSTRPFLQCIAVSQTSDATGAYNVYAFSFGNRDFNDYPKFGIWPDGYYATYNIFARQIRFKGAQACAYDGAAMRAGTVATAQCFQLSASFGGLLPSDLDGTTPPPVGTPNYFVNFGNNRLNIWRFHADFATPANATFLGPTAVPVAAFSAACNGGTCIPQAETTQNLDSLADRLMYRLAYRNLGGVQSLLVNHSVTADTSVGIRWYELRIANQAPVVFQQGTYAPDATYRWMGSIAMDKVGNIGLGYSASSSTISPAIRYTGRVPSDPLGTLQTENSILVGGGSQQGSNLSRWGDYSTLSVDPVDDCTFWFTTEYLKSNGAFNWSTRIASFKFPGCQ
ncbi:hypothetical protein [Anthocerotibacter panamensis]|uniref:hypothetical protein n=1 Tax=Anthocerotibacter panamensis TaxID=2857077 RepID=UPI001C407CF6|nr:hypothetical protein [Anthocerotibacter panamensis]